MKHVEDEAIEDMFEWDEIVAFDKNARMIVSLSWRSWLYFLCEFDISYSSVRAIAIFLVLFFSYSSI